MSRERFVQSNFRFVLKPTEVLNYGAHFADPDMYVSMLKCVRLMNGS